MERHSKYRAGLLFALVFAVFSVCVTVPVYAAEDVAADDFGQRFAGNAPPALADEGAFAALAMRARSDEAGFNAAAIEPAAGAQDEDSDAPVRLEPGLERERGGGMPTFRPVPQENAASR